ncbi:DNA-dependent protein kinase catalytic subunit [Portunus trituberculatus]|uniref:DNA-dependent protein kinase catalytic subunit n=1 Tax=Portunus trituberculatus TaxID=210409 RepID=A0A5B7GZD7_PORTR|nr:DNA-dependent protein kinase catalytic subunit [Portunus trituberculatus]
MLANGLAPYTEGSVAEKTKCEKILLKLLEAHYASVYGAAAEVVGLVLKFQNSQSEVFCIGNTFREESTQLVSLELVNAALPRLSPSQVLYFLPGIMGFATHPGAKCREMMYDILFWIHDNFR